MICSLRQIVGQARRLGERSGIPAGRSSSIRACSAATACASEMIARLGHEAGDILDEFLSFCLAEERAGLPGLEAFLATLESAGTRDQARDGPGPRRGPHHDRACGQGPGGAGGVPGRRRHGAVQRAASAAADAVRAAGRLARQGLSLALGRARSPTAFPAPPRRGSKERADDEYRRLLYVGMTRAEDRLIVCGYHGKRARNAATWHSIVSRALVGIPETRGAGASGDDGAGAPFPQSRSACRVRPKSAMTAVGRAAAFAAAAVRAAAGGGRPAAAAVAVRRFGADRGCQGAGRLGPLAGARRRGRAGFRHGARLGDPQAAADAA